MRDAIYPPQPITWITMYIRAADRSIIDGRTRRSRMVFQDDRKFHWVFGCTIHLHDDATNEWAMERPFWGMIAEMGIYQNYNLGLWDINEFALFQCDEYCPICRMKDGSKCIEEFVDGFEHVWDMAPFVYEPIIPDWSPNAWHLPHDPRSWLRYVHNNGIYNHNAASLTLLTAIDWEIASFTMDAWVRFTYEIRNNFWVV